MTQRNVFLFGWLGLLLTLLPATAPAQFTFTTNSDNTLNLYQYTGSDGAVIIPNIWTNGLRVTSIGSDAFYQDYTLTSVTIGTNVANLAAQAFFQCPSFASVSIPASTTNIGQAPFFDCQGLTSISVNASNKYYLSTNQILFNKTLTTLVQYPGGLTGTYGISAAVTNAIGAFVGNNLSAIVVSNANLYYSSTNGVLFNKNFSVLLNYPGAVSGNYLVPRSVLTINSAAFEYCANIGSVVIGTNVTSIGSFALYDCPSLTSITVSNANLYYSSTNGVLFDKKQFTLIQFPSGLAAAYSVPGTVTNIADGAFGDAFGLTSIAIPDSVTSIGAETFYSCQNLASVSLGDHVANIGQQAFYYCTSLTDIALPNSVTNIALLAFYYCPALQSVTFGNGLKTIGLEAFGDCQSLTNACFAGKPPTDGGSIFYFDNSLSTILYVSSNTGWSATYDGIATAPCAACTSDDSPPLNITRAGNKVILTWSSAFTGFTLQSTPNLAPAAVWSTVTPAPTIVNSLDTVTNTITGTHLFYRLMSP